MTKGAPCESESRPSKERIPVDGVDLQCVVVGFAEATDSDGLGANILTAQSDLDGDDFNPVSAPKMVFCTVGLERFPK